MGNAFVSLGRTAEALDSYRQALTINPGYAEAHFNLGVLAMTQGRQHEAVNSLRRAIEFAPTMRRRTASSAPYRAVSGSSRSRRRSLRRAYSIEPESAEILYDLAMMLQYRGKLRRGCRCWCPRSSAHRTGPPKQPLPTALACAVFRQRPAGARGTHGRHRRSMGDAVTIFAGRPSV